MPEVPIVRVDCYCCHVPIWMTVETKAQLVNKGDTFFCINGHSQCFTKSTEEKLREEREKASRLQTKLSLAEARKEALERKIKAIEKKKKADIKKHGDGIHKAKKK